MMRLFSTPLAVLALVLAFRADANAAINAGARVILAPLSPLSTQVQVGVDSASATATQSYVTWYDLINTEAGSADVLGASTNGFLKARVEAYDPFFNPWGYDGPARGTAYAAWQDVIYSAHDMPQIRLVTEVSFTATLKDFSYNSSGSATLLFRLQGLNAPLSNITLINPPSYGVDWGRLWGQATRSNGADPRYYHNTNPYPGAWDSVAAFVTPEVIEFVARKSIVLNYNPLIGGYGYRADFQVEANAQGLRVIADGGNSASIVDITDLEGNSIRDSISFASGMAFPTNEAVPEPASLLLWLGASSCLGLAAYRRRLRGKSADCG